MTDCEYGIHPLVNIKDVYIWKHRFLENAKEVARELSSKHGVEVIVFKIVGSYKPEIIWNEEIIWRGECDEHIDP